MNNVRNQAGMARPIVSRKYRNYKFAHIRQWWLAGRPALFLMIVFIAGLLFRLWLSRYRFAVGFDEVNYLKLGVSASLYGLSEVLHPYWSPFFPTLIALFASLFSDYELAGRLASIVLGALVPIPVYFLAKKLYTEAISRTAAVIVALFPAIAFHDTQVLTESTYAFFLLITIYLGQKMLIRYSTVYAYLTGLTGALVYLTRPEGVGVLAVISGWIVVGSLAKLYLIKPLRMVYLFFALGLGFLPVAAPYLFYLKQETGRWTLSTKGKANLMMDTAVDGKIPNFRKPDSTYSVVPIDAVFHTGDFLKYIDQKADARLQPPKLKPIIQKYIKHFYKMLAEAIPTFFTAIPLILLGIGLFGKGWENKQGKPIAYYLSFIIFYWLLVIPLFHINKRYLIPLWPLTTIWIAHGLYIIFSWLRYYPPLLKRLVLRKIHPDFAATVILGTVLFVLVFLPELGRVLARNPNSTEYWADAVEQKKAGLWLRSHTEQPPIIMSRNHAVDFYAGNYNIRETVTIPNCDLECVLRYAKNRGVQYLVLNERYASDYPRLAKLLQKSGAEFAKDKLELVYWDRDAAGLITVIYKIL